MPLDISEYNCLKVVNFYGKLDLNVALALEPEVLTLMEHFNEQLLLIDISNSDYVSASMMHLFLSMEEKAKNKSIKIGIIGSGNVQKIFERVGINSFRMYNSLEEASGNIIN